MALTKAKASNILLTTPAASSNDVTPATTEYVTTALANMVDSAPSTLNTLNELAAALGDDANFSTTVTNSIAGKLPLAGGTLTGNLTLSYAYPRINFTDTNHDSDYSLINNDGKFGIYDATNSAYRFHVAADGKIGIGTTNPAKTLHVEGNAFVSGQTFLGDASGDTVTLTGSLAHAGNFTIDAGGNIELDADGGQVYFKDNGLTGLIVSRESTSIDLHNATTNSDFKFKGSDDGSNITALTLDMSEAGAASFNAGATFGGGVTMSGSLLIDSSSSASIGLDRGNDTSGSTIDFKTSGTLKWYMGLRGLSNDNFYVRNEAGSTDALTILTSGNVGIGETSPLGKLHIKGTDVGASPASTANQLVLEDTENGLSILSAAAGAGYINFGDSGDNAKGGFIYDHSADAMRHIANGGEKMRIASNGYVGIGTSSPAVNLHVNEDASNSYAYLRLEGANRGGWIQMYDGSNAVSSILTDQSGNMNFQTASGYGGNNPSTRMLIAAGGNVGIGTTSPGNKLTVNGGFSSNNFRAVGTGQTYAGSNRNMFIGTAAGVASYASYPGGSGSPTTYDYSLEVGDGGRGFQITADWLSTTGAGPYYVRTLRDCCQNWSSYHTLNITAVSDRRTKTDIENITSPRTIIDALQGITYMPVNPDGTIGHIDRENPDPDNLQENMVEREREYGYIAQDVVDIIPSVVDYHEKLDEPNEHGWANAYMLRYERLVPVLTEALKECYSKIDALETKITELEG